MSRPVARTFRRSRTVFGSLLGLLGLVATFSNDAVQLALDAAAQFSALAPIVGIATALGIEPRTVTFGMGVAGFALAMFARLNDAHTGANQK
jgi:hypothetical protein